MKIFATTPIYLPIYLFTNKNPLKTSKRLRIPLLIDQFVSFIELKM